MASYHSKGRVPPQFLLDLPYRDKIVSINVILKEIEEEKKEHDKMLAKYGKK